MAIRYRISDVRARYVVIFLAFSFIVLAGRIFSLQVISHAYYRQVSDENSMRMVPISAPRGVIKDRNGELLVANRPLYNISYLPYKGEGEFASKEYLADLIKTDPDIIEQKLDKPIRNRFDPIKLVKDVDFEAICKIEENSERLPGVIYQLDVTRQYPLNNYGSHLFGYVGEISDAELKGRDPNVFKPGDIIGIGGIEEEYDNYLRGRDGVKYLEVSASGKILGYSPHRQSIPPEIGSELILNIDWQAQSVAESLLSSYSGGAVVAIDPSNGGVLVFVSQPNFDANAFAGFVTNELWSQVSNDPAHSLLNRACVGTYPPGSIFKPITAGAALETNSADVNSVFRPCYGAMRFGNREFRCWKPSGHGQQNMFGAIVHSCDIYFYQLGLATGFEAWSRYCIGSGFGQKTGIDFASESRGVAPSTAYLNRKYGEKKWSKSTVINLAIGQGEVLVTPLQMACFYAAIANGGTMYKPQIVSKIVNPGGDRKSVV